MPIIIDSFEQHSEEWFAAICGNVGASNIDKIITTTGARSKQREDFMYQLAGERICGKREETFQSQAMKNGREREANARSVFSMIQGIEVKQVGVVYKDEWKLCHCSPDGLTENSGLEMKNPMMKTHVRYLLNGKLPTDYFCQIQMSLYVTERDLWYFMSYYDGIKPLIIECRRDEAFIKKLSEELDAFNMELLTIVEKLK
ncbi:MAG: lambda exonuclease family protein [Smithella sp.]